ncbi:MAG: dimethylargininase [Nakamurella sp.]
MTMTAPFPTSATETSASTQSAATRRPTARRYAMTRPDHFVVTYAINPWMDTTVPVSTERAVAQWEVLRALYLKLGHTVDLVPSVAGLPDMVYAANGALSLPGFSYKARFAYPERAREADAYAAFLEAQDLGPVREATFTNEGEGDYLVVGRRILAGTGFRTDVASHRELAELSGMEVVTLELVDPRFYHLDTALSVLADETIAYYPAAFSPDALATLQRLYPDAIIATEADAVVLGLNAVSDGYHVILSERATGMIEQLRERGFAPIGIDLSELFKGGGSVKCCTLEIRS